MTARLEKKSSNGVSPRESRLGAWEKKSREEEVMRLIREEQRERENERGIGNEEGRKEGRKEGRESGSFIKALSGHDYYEEYNDSCGKNEGIFIGLATYSYTYV